MRFKNFYENNLPVLTEAVRKELKAVDKSIGQLNATVATEVYEIMAVIVAMAGKKLKMSDVKKTLKNPEAPKQGRDHINKLIKLFKGKAGEVTLLKYIEFIGGQMRVMLKKAGLSKAPTSFILADIGTYYNTIDPSLIDSQSKQNTADTVLIWGGQPKNVYAYLNKLTDANAASHVQGKGIINIGKKVKILQVSLKKTEGDARIGKLGAFVTAYLGKRQIMPADQIKQYATEGVIYEGVMSDMFKKAFDATVSTIKAAYGKVKSIASKLQSIFGSFFADMVEKKKKADERVRVAFDLENSIIHSGKAGLKESASDQIPLTDAVTKNLNAFFELAGSGVWLLKEFDKVISKTKTLNKSSDEKGHELINLVYTRANFEDYIDGSNKRKKEWEEMKAKGAKSISRNWFRPIRMLNANYIGYTLINDLLDKIEKEAGSMKSLKKASIAFAVDAQSDAIFGNTRLPLWKVFGGDTPPHFLSTKTEFKKDKLDKLKKLKMADPTVKIVIRATKGEIYNSIKMYILSDVDEKGNISYLFGEINTVSGSQFTYKMEMSSTVGVEHMRKAA